MDYARGCKMRLSSTDKTDRKPGLICKKYFPHSLTINDLFFTKYRYGIIATSHLSIFIFCVCNCPSATLQSTLNCHLNIPKIYNGQFQRWNVIGI